MTARRAFLASTLGFAASVPFASLGWAQDAAQPEIADMVLGDADAPVTVIEYASFTCPHCAAFHENVMGKLKTNYIDTGKIRFIHREVFFDRFGLWASMIARCGGEMRYFGMIDRIYGTQREWTAASDPTAIVDNLRRIGLSSGLSAADLDACMSDQENAQALVNWYSENAKKDEVQATPSFIIDGEKYSNMGYAKFAEVLDEKLGD